MKQSLPTGLYFTALGGLGAIGANCYVYGISDGNEEQYIMVDCGIGFASGTHKAVDALLPDTSFLEQRKSKLKGIVITHGHEDHIGALPYLMKRFAGVPIYATAFTADLIRTKMKANGEEEPFITLVQQQEEVDIGKFIITWVGIQHSIPDSSLVSIKSPYGTVVHSGDFKSEHNPTLGLPISEDALAKIRAEKPLALLCDSTNVMQSGHTPSEISIVADIERIIQEHEGKGIFVTLFSSNIARMNTLFQAAEKSGRKVILAARSMEMYYHIAKQHGFIKSNHEPIILEPGETYDKSKALVLCSGSQAEARSNLWQTVFNNAKRIPIDKNDVVIFSSKIIPGNDTRLSELYNGLIAMGVTIITATDNNIHVSGHPKKEDIIELYKGVQPLYVIPMHGEGIMLQTHVTFAKQQGYKALMVNEGEILQIHNSATCTMKVVETFKVDQQCFDGKRITSADGSMIKERIRTLLNGGATISIIIDKKGLPMTEPHITTFGLIEPFEEAQMNKALFKIIDKSIRSSTNNDGKIRDNLIRDARRYFLNTFGKKTLVHIHLFRYGG